MAAWFSVYCARSLSDVTAADLRAALDGLDFYTIAEGFGIEDESVVDQALSFLHIEPVSEPLGVRLRVRYRSGNARPLLVHLWSEPERVREECAESLEKLASDRRRGASRVRSHLGRVVEVAAVELGIGQLEDMGLVLSGQVAEYIATVGNGLIRDADDDWWAVSGGVPRLLLGSGESAK